jgi:diacylglycerol kinase family enzyme
MLPRNANRVVLLINPKAGPKASQPRAERLAELLRQQGLPTEVFTDLDAATAQANRLHAEGSLRTLVAAGGDGTAADVVNRTVDGLPITLLAAGNSNLLAKYYDLSKDPEIICQTIIDGHIARVDAGLAGDRIFLLMASCGFDADVVHRIHEHRTGHINLLTYLNHIAKAIWSYQYPEIRVHWDAGNGVEAEAPWSARWLFVFNHPCYGGGFRIAPQADGTDGLFDVCGFRRGGLWPGLWLATTILARQHHRLADWTTRRVRRLRITAEGKVPYQLDGDPGGFLPVEIEILPGRLTLVVPKTDTMELV